MKQFMLDQQKEWELEREQQRSKKLDYKLKVGCVLCWLRGYFAFDNCIQSGAQAFDQADLAKKEETEKLKKKKKKKRKKKKGLTRTRIESDVSDVNKRTTASGASSWRTRTMESKWQNILSDGRSRTNSQLDPQRVNNFQEIWNISVKKELKSQNTENEQNEKKKTTDCDILGETKNKNDVEEAKSGNVPVAANIEIEVKESDQTEQQNEQTEQQTEQTKQQNEQTEQQHEQSNDQLISQVTEIVTSEPTKLTKPQAELQTESQSQSQPQQTDVTTKNTNTDATIKNTNMDVAIESTNMDVTIESTNMDITIESTSTYIVIENTSMDVTIENTSTNTIDQQEMCIQNETDVNIPVADKQTDKIEKTNWSMQRIMFNATCLIQFCYTLSRNFKFLNSSKSLLEKL